VEQQSWLTPELISLVVAIVGAVLGYLARGKVAPAPPPPDPSLPPGVPPALDGVLKDRPILRALLKAFLERERMVMADQERADARKALYELRAVLDPQPDSGGTEPR
jgi:hypothetical protein